MYGAKFSHSGKIRSVSTSVNRVEFPGISSPVPSVRESLRSPTMTWEEGTFTAKKLNCFKKKKKVEALIQLYDKNAVTSVQDERIFIKKLDEITTASLDAIEFFDDIIADLEINEETDRIAVIQDIKQSLVQAVKTNANEVKAQMQKVLLEAISSNQGVASDQTSGVVSTNTSVSSNSGSSVNIAEEVRQVLSQLNISAGNSGSRTPNVSSDDQVARLSLRQTHILEDAEEFQKVLGEIKLATEMSDSEVIYFMKKSESWNKKIEDLISSNRKFQEEALNNVDIAQMAEELDEKIKLVKTLKENKVAAISKVDLSRNLNSLCQNRNKESVVFPDPFRGVYGENVFKFKEDIVSAIRDSQVKKADEVKTLVKYLRGEAKARVGDYQPSLEKALEVLLEFYGNANLIWSRCREDFKQKFSGNIAATWGELGSTKRVDTIATVLDFIRQAKQYAHDYPNLKQEIMSSNTVELLTQSMPIDYLEMVYLSIDDPGISEMEKIDKMENILCKLKTCGILAVNQLASKDNYKRNEKSKSNYVGKNSAQPTFAALDPLGTSLPGSICVVDSRHKCHKSQQCQPNWGLLGCIELYRLKTIEDRIAYCKASKCCYVCGTSDLSSTEVSVLRHKRCDYKKPVDRFLTRCTAQRFIRSLNKKVPCFFGAALCPDHKGIKNTNPELLNWLNDHKIDHDMFTMRNKVFPKGSVVLKSQKKHCPDPQLKSDCEVMDMLKQEMTKADFENGDIQDIPEGESLFMFLLLQGKPGTEPMQVFCDSGANFWFAVESVTRKLVSIQTYKGSLPINVAGGNVIYATGEWAAALPLADGTYQAVRGLTMKNVVGQMQRYNLERVLSSVKAEYKQNKRLQGLKIPPVLGGEVDMILGSKYLRIYPEPVQTTPSGLTVSVSKLRSPNGMKSAVISGPVKLLNQIFETKHARDCIESMKAMLLNFSSYRPNLDYFPKRSHIVELIDADMLEEEKSDKDLAVITKNGLSRLENSPLVPSYAENDSSCSVTVQQELQKFMDLQEAGLRTDFRCRQCRKCEDCKRGAGYEKLSLKQEAEQQLIKESIFIDKDAGVAVAKLPFTLNPDSNLACNRGRALGMLNNVVNKYCTDDNTRQNMMSAWHKMINNGHLLFLDDLSPEQKDNLINSKVSYWIPWNVQFKDSISTPLRPVFNASSITSTGLSLNDCIAKGNPDLVKLLAVLLDWQLGKSAVCGDISQFYPSIQLISDHWKYQRILLKKDFEPAGEVLEAVLVKLGFGVQSVSAQTEEVIRRIATELWDTLPEVAALLIKRRYVDDMAKGTNSRSESVSLIEKTSKVLYDELKMNVKGWALAGCKPPPEISKDGMSVDLGGMLWYTEADLYTLNLPPLCFTKKKRGKLPDNAVLYDPKTMILEEFVPRNLTRRMITSSVAAQWDMTGKIAPVTLRIKHDLRRLIAESPEWDASVSQLSRGLWIQNFDILDRVRDFVYVRNSRPSDALRSSCRLWIMVDAAEWGLMVTVYVGWERSGGDFSCAHLYGKGILGPEALTLPQKELHIFSVGADLSELLSVMLEDWVEEVNIAGDSEIALCWIGYESVKLNQYNRVRVINILSKVSLDNIFHIKGSENPADIGTRMHAISASDVQPGSTYLTGKDWMKLKVDDAVTQGFIRPINAIKLGHEERKVLKKGIIYDNFEDENSDVIASVITIRLDVNKVAQREVQSNYPYSPLKRNFLSLVNITGLVLKAVKKFKSKLKPTLDKSEANKFSIKPFYADKLVKILPEKFLTESDRDYALQFIFQEESKLVKKFNSAKKLDAIAIEENGILFSKTRVLEGQSVKVVGGLKVDTSLTNLFNLNFKVPLVDQHSPLAYPLALHLHSLFNHRGVESCHRLALNYVYIMGGLQIFKNISLNCVVCQKDRKKYLKMVMGSLSDSQLTISPLFYYVMVDIWGPLTAYCPGYERATRRDKSYNVYFLVFVCVSTGAVNIQLIEGKSTEFILEGCSRFYNEASVPKILYTDDDGAMTKAFREGEMDIEDLSGSLLRTKGIMFEICPPQAHSQHGKVERMIRSLQDSFNRSGASSSRCTATGWQTIGKTIERDINDMPIGFLYDQSYTNGNPLLRVLRPSTLKGINSSDRAPRGLFSIPDLPHGHFSKVQEVYDLWAKCWATSYVPLILSRQKWHEADDNLNPNDIIYFKLEDSLHKPTWRLGKVENVNIGRDGKVRDVTVAYKILKDDGSWSHSVVSRPTREIVKLFELKDTNFSDDLKAVQRAAHRILEERGAVADIHVLYNCFSQSSAAVSDERSDISDNYRLENFFLTCLDTKTWLEQDSNGSEVSCCVDGSEELLFLM